MSIGTLVTAAILLLAATSAAIGQESNGAVESTNQQSNGAQESNKQESNKNKLIDLSRDISIDQKLDAQVPLSLAFRDESGREVVLDQLVGEKPVILTLVYYNCPMLCGLELNGLVRCLRSIEWDVGDEFRVVTVSIDPEETPELAAKKKKNYLTRYGRDGADDGWHFLTGEKQPIRELAQAVGFRYRKDPDTGEYAHAAGMMLLTPEGKISRYFYGVDFPPRDVRLGLVEASQDKIGSTADRVLLFCYAYDPTTGKYSLAILNILRAAGVATVLVLGGSILAMIRRDRRSANSASETTNAPEATASEWNVHGANSN